MAQYSIKDVETLSGVKAHTLRIWEQRYNFVKPHRTGTNIRYFTDEQLKNILNIALLNRNGTKISKIAGMSAEDLKKEVLRITTHHIKPNVLLDSLIHAMIDFDEARFEKALSQSIVKLGFEHTFSKVVFPMLERTGILWSTGTVRPAQEHFISNLIRRKLSVAIDNQYVNPTRLTRKFVLFLPDGEIHEILLLFTEYLLRVRNHEVAYIGNSLPFEDIDFINKAFKPDCLVTYFTIPPREMALQLYLDKLSASFPAIRIFISGTQVVLQKPVLPSNVTFINSMDGLLAEI
jgi:DNA-binding transcriptional MerR regulator